MKKRLLLLPYYRIRKVCIIRSSNFLCLTFSNAVFPRLVRGIQKSSYIAGSRGQAAGRRCFRLSNLKTRRLSINYSFSTYLGTILSALLILTLLIPTIQCYRPFFKHEIPLYGYTDPIPKKPTPYLKAYFNKSLQQWIETYFNSHFGFRDTVIRTFNEISFRLFREAKSAHVNILVTKKHGLYSNLSIDSLNAEILQKDKLEKKYQETAKKLLEVQTILEKQNKYFIVVIASSKAYIYPKELSARYLVGGGNTDILKRAANFGEILKATGVHVIDSRPLLRTFTHKTHLETHPVSGVHWNYASSCIITSQILKQTQALFPNIAQLSCGKLERRIPPMNYTDVDGYLLLNIWSHAGLIKPSTYPTILKNNTPAFHPKIVMIGDSFSDFLRAALKEGNVPAHITMSSYFQRRSVNEADNNSTQDLTKIRNQLLDDIKTSQLIVLEMVDYNASSRLDYGFGDYFLKHQQQFSARSSQ